MLYTPDIVQLSKDNTTSKFDKSKFDAAISWVYGQKEYGAEMLEQEPGVNLIRETGNILTNAFNQGIASGVLPPEMESKLRESVFVFSACKTHQELTEVSSLLRTTEGKVKPFEQFSRDVASVHVNYNVHYLKAEYQFAVTSSQMAAKWADIERDGDRYNLQYRTADDTNVREAHRALHNVTLPPTDPFWDKYYPPNGWGCRCNIAQVRKSKYEASDPEQAMANGLTATRQMSGDVDKGAIFRFNPGKSREIFPPKHPYYKIPDDDKSKIETIIKPVIKQIQTKEDLNVLMATIDANKNWFASGFQSINIETRKGANGSTDMRGNVWLTKERLNLSIDGINKLNKGLNIEIKEADALATLWHEITHNRNSASRVHMSPLQRSKMELANEFVARNTLPEFYEGIGAKMQYSRFMENRDSTGYNTMVRNYDSIIRRMGIDKNAVVKSVKDYLFNESYDTQELGLIKSLTENGATKNLTKTAIKTLVKRCDKMDESDFNNYLESLFIKD